jgi:hypothetical protein
MTRITVLRDECGGQEMTYRAVGRHVQAAGRTAGEAVDALASQLPQDETETLILVRDLRPNRFFSAEERRRLTGLMALWRAARDRGQALPDPEQAELQDLVDREIRATTERAEDAWRELSR